MKKKYVEQVDSENEFSVDEPEELQGSDDDWTPVAGEGAGRRTSRRLRNTPATKKPRLAEPSSSEDEDEEDDEDGEEDESFSDESDGESKSKTKKGKLTSGAGLGRQKKGQVTSTSLPVVKKGKKDDIISCEATSTTGAPMPATGPPDKEFTSGTFVVLKTDFQNGGDPPIWKIDGKALLQKYVPFEQEGKTLYKNTSTYSGWSANNKELYYAAPITFKMQNRKETVVEFLRESVKEDKDDSEAGEAGEAETTSGQI